jgi:uncharacterized protein (TIGR02421 family)
VSLREQARQAQSAERRSAARRVARAESSSAQPKPPQPSAADVRALHAFEAKLAPLARAVRLLPALTAANAKQERARLEALLVARERPIPRFAYADPRACGAGLRFVDLLRAEAAQLPGARLYLAKLEELELDLALLASLGHSRRVRPLAARRFGNGDEVVTLESGSVSLFEYSQRLLRGRALRRVEPLLMPADAPDGTSSLRALIEAVAGAAGLPVIVRVEPNLTAGAATGDRTVYLADRAFAQREAQRLAVHEVLGHLASAANGRAQPLRLLEWGTGFAFADQEGVALCIEAEFGLLDRGRLRSLAGRVLATRMMHAEASFAETAQLLYREYGFSASESIAISERAYRGGGVARDAGYLLGLLRVRSALERGRTTLDEMRMGRVGLDALAELRELVAAGLLREPAHRPNLSRSFFSTSGGTMPWRSPPNAAASLINVELT